MILHGKDILILKSDGTAVIGAAKSCQIEVKTDTIEVSSPTTGQWKQYITGRKGWSVSISHLVLSRDFPANLWKVGNEVTIQANVGFPFDGFTEDATVQQTGLNQAPSAIYWDTVRKKFLGFYQLKYYQTWTGSEEYSYPAADAPFQQSNGTVYVYTGTDLTAVGKFAGTGIVTQADVSATVGSLATGSLKILGNGALSS